VYERGYRPAPTTAGPRIGELALAAALGYLDLRFESAWRDTPPTLVAWLDDFARRVPSFARTAA
jgi:glutathione S-transferase